MPGRSEEYDAVVGDDEVEGAQVDDGVAAQTAAWSKSTSSIDSRAGKRATRMRPCPHLRPVLHAQRLFFLPSSTRARVSGQVVIFQMPRPVQLSTAVGTSRCGARQSHQTARSRRCKRQSSTDSDTALVEVDISTTGQ